MKLLVQVIRDEVEIVETIFYQRDPVWKEERMHEVEDVTLADAFFLSGLCSSKSEARRLIDGGGAYVNNRRCMTEEEWRSTPMILDRYFLLRKGKKHISLLEFVPVRFTLRWIHPPEDEE